VNNTGSDEVYFTIDTGAPAVAISSPANTTYATNNLTVNYTTDGISCALYLDGSFNESLTSCENTTLTELTDGQHYVAIYSNDSVNNTGSDEVYFTVDTTAPSISITSPANTTYATNNLTVNYTTNGASCSLFLDGIFNASLSSCENSTLSNLSDGQHYVTVYANDSVNNTGSDEVYFIVDTAAPIVTLSSPANTTYSTNNLTVNYTTDGVSCSMFLDGTFNESLASCENTTLTELADGQHYVTIYSNDSVNNTGSDEVYFIVDTTSPIVSISSPANTTYSTTNVTVSYTTDGTTCSLYLDGTFNTTLTSCENTTLSGLSEAQHYVTVYANDSANNTGSDEVYFTITLTAPGISISSPSNTTYPTTNVTVNYTTDGVSCALFLNGTFNQSLTGCENTTISNLADGQHYVTIYANNSMNVTGSGTVYFITDTTGPTVTITSPANTTYSGTSATLSYSISDISSVDSCWLYINGTFNQSLPGCSGTTISGLSYGQNNFTVYANDSMGNNGSATVHFTLTEEGAVEDRPGSEPDYECFTNSDCGECEVCRDHECSLPPQEDACATASDCSGTQSPFYECTSCTCKGYGCFTDADCDEGETCGANNLCAPSTCINGSGCAQGYSCINQTCIPPECFNDKDCAEGYSCSNYSCILWQCIIDADCAEGEACHNGACIPPECLEDADCTSHGEGYTCSGYSCIAPECTRNNDCGENQECVDYACVDKEEPPVEEGPQEGEAGEEGEGQPAQEPPPQEEGPEGEIPLVSGLLDTLSALLGKPQEAAGAAGEGGLAGAALPLLLLLAALAIIYFLWKRRRKGENEPYKWKGEPKGTAN
ncbi:hypothetical protein JW721_01265, partial [Candidatus Micrarchaeota archaeon]|nr:hypothetical protein [Candidatus Micrarchaeota archaeon]